MATFSRLGRYIKPYAVRMVLGIVLLSAAGAVAGLVVSAFKPLVNQVLLLPEGGETSLDATDESTVELVNEIRDWIDQQVEGLLNRGNTYLTVPLAILFLAGLRGLFLYFGIYLMSSSGARVIRDLRAALYGAIVHQSTSFFREHSSGNLISRVISDVQRLHGILTRTLANLIREAAIVPFMLIVVLLHDWRMSIFMVGIIPLLVLPTLKLSRRLRRASFHSQEATAEVTELANETVLGIRVVQAFGMEEFEVSRFRSALGRLLRVDLKAIRIGAISPPMVELICSLAAVVLFFFGGWAIAEGRLDAGDFSVVLVGLTAIFAVVRRLNRFNIEIQQALPAAGRIFEILDRQRDIENAADAHELKGFRESLIFESVDFAYEHKQVLDNISLTIQRGEMIAIVGSSGSGKSTLANLVPRFLDPTEGRILIDGFDLREIRVESLRSQIGLVTQETVLFDETVRANIAYGRADIPTERIVEAAQAAHAMEFIEQFPAGLETNLGERGTNLSAGQRQRLAIARALLKDPPILILDEATSALDTETESLVQEALDTLLAGRTSIVIAHRLSTIRRADRILVLSAGRIVEQGTHRDLLERGGHYARLHRRDFDADPVVEPTS